ncbi:arylamine N-acetyltransferase family protein [Burkholderia gladioli]|uniref:arylamine N-acetyltransferase family protein n=1 Tax=Burkholderia gladioli TaxID=28095 RepID=UPI000CFFE047|nr:arylamine N-acetyltransferase [Burkholderia gladioli]MBJ9673636.1 arylamine N-acetyltransferase [Burkholderia gladioli]MBU9173770.1 arylamine N-acetyltransferase [Burkholderia gladioli]MBU9323087.1 arylamine N-acetyltransferase [Burkholderia gladioli]MDN7459362.1 arylamine N-acetyltransferase [Burkholderia gladioli]PRG99758.1 N-hydroxyarylamine O-acetyltransferase [Burkholderia gladioli]
MHDDLDLPAYLERIGYRGEVAPTLDALRRLHRLHPAAIAFENLDSLTGAPVRLDLPSLGAKLVARRRGGYCFEQNRLFQAVLERFGFRVTPLIARVRWQRPPELVAAQTHMLLRVELDGAAWNLDVGFGAVTQTAPLAATPGVAQRTPHGEYRLVEAPGADVFDLEFRAAKGWQPVYRFVARGVEQIDYEVANWYTSTHPDSKFVNDLIVSRVLPEGRAALLNDTLTLRDASGAATRHERLADAAAWAACLDQRFDLDLDGFDIEQLFARVQARSAALDALAQAQSQSR